MSDVSIVIPSMNRADRLLYCVARALATTAGHNVEIVVALDCDTESRDRLLALQDSRVKVLFNAERQGAIVCWNQGLAAARGPIYVFGNDDCDWVNGWLDAALQAHQEQLGGYGLVGFSDGYQDGNRLSVQYLFDRQFCIDVLGGVIAYPVYEFYCNDTEANARAKASGHFFWCQEAVVQHRHWSRPGEEHFDELDHENQPKAVRDEARFRARQAAGFPNDFMPVLRAIPLKIAVLSDARLPTSPDFPGHGLGKINLAIATGLRARGYDVTLFAGPGSVFGGPLVTGYHEADFYLKDRLAGFDVVLDGGHEHEAACVCPGLKVVNLSHDREFAPGQNAVFVSEAHRAFHKQPGRVIHNGIDVEAFVPGPHDGGYVAFLGAPFALKGPFAAWQAAQIAGVPIRLAGPNDRWWGLTPDGPKSGAEKVAFLGGAMALLNPASKESAGLTCLEAAACGTPVIAFRLGGLPEYVCEGVTGFLVEDIDGMASAIAQVGMIDPQQARAWVAEHRGLAQMIDGYEQALNDAARGETW